MAEAGAELRGPREAVATAEAGDPTTPASIAPATSSGEGEEQASPTTTGSEAEPSDLAAEGEPSAASGGEREPDGSVPESAEAEPGAVAAEEPAAPTTATGGEPSDPVAEGEPSAASGREREPDGSVPESAEAEPGAVAADEPAAPTTATGGDLGDPAAEGEPEAETSLAKPRPVWLQLPALLLAAALVLAGAGVWFTVEARSAAGTSAGANLALTDVGATAEVTSAITVAVNRVFSYSYDRTDVTEKAAAAVLRGAAKDSYDKLFAQVRAKAPEQKLVLTSRVSAIAVQELRDNHARLLVFLDQSAVRADNNATDNAAAQLSVTAERADGTWVITALEPR
ncbi:hypothetical protein MUY14_27600 [Amycolatopsis sp. FBCC-B4732]|uniref:hypothetical protein n=1 Tax=Amycolatopsis sp. FBCC-B4732 TaxID=3079339 RepID=UPI001FF35B5D|nr:hypothetical protein [Amycolatopsis sp. FBCC-B4732]UOX85541.1 hypothetical protein MUY14_27600 [Amycolatopsis sp. FBCC-B4732]